MQPGLTSSDVLLTLSHSRCPAFTQTVDPSFLEAVTLSGGAAQRPGVTVYLNARGDVTVLDSGVISQRVLRDLCADAG